MSDNERTPNDVQAEQEDVMKRLRAALQPYEGTDAPILDIGNRILRLYDELTAAEKREDA